MSQTIALSSNLKKLLLQKGLSLHQLSRKTNINKSTLHNYLSGVHPQGVDVLVKLAVFFEVSVEQLLFDTKESPRALKAPISLTEGHFEITIKKME